MNDNELKLLQGLRGLALDGPRQAPASVEERLVGELRRRSRARRRNRWLAMGMSGAVAAVLAVTLWIRTEPVVQKPTLARSPAPSAVKTSQPPAADLAPASEREAPDRGADVAINFYPLPDADELPPLDSATIVRVQLPMASLRLMGLPVSEDRAAEFIQADMLLGQDGLARGVRFVQ
jgi:hypothetical protein